MKRYPRPRRFSIRREEDDESENRRFDFRKYRKKGPVSSRYVIWLVLVFAVVIFQIRYLTNVTQ